MDQSACQGHSGTPDLLPRGVTPECRIQVPHRPHRKGVMTTSKPNDSPDEPTGAATAQAKADGVGEAEEKPDSVAAAAERALTAARSSRGSAVPSAMAEPEAEQRKETEEPEEAETNPVALGLPESTTTSAKQAEAAEAENSGDSSSAQSAEAEPAPEAVADAKNAESETASTATADTPGSAGDATGSSARTAVNAVPGRPHKSLLAGAAIVGALLVSVPFMISGGNGDDGRPSVKPGATPGTVLDGVAAGAVPGVVGSESPSPHVNRSAAPKIVSTTTGPDGKKVTVTMTPQAGKTSGGKKSSGGGKATTAAAGSGTTSSHSGSTSGGKTSTSSGPKSNTTNRAASSDPWPGGVWIYSHASGRCIGIAGSPGAATGSALVIWDCYNKSYQRWKFVNGTVQSEGKCMNVSGGATGDGAVINWTTCNGSGAQQFRLNSSHDLTNPQSGNKCVDVKDKSTDNGARLQLWTCAGTDNQKWSTRTP
ncbi:ricin-type beta-trefoil lectin domain protein [Streptomyces sp. NPDC001276]|uniref:ricin-type beta-trefoil lectin domain protein n=1 Tax=Streptomyces sp. NPDC001276 TaxID=3364555 RepID=UPI0036B660CC